MNILAVGAHPDDVTNCIGGTLAKYAKLGHKIFVADATSGNIGSAHHTKEEIAAIRKKEAKNACDVIGAEYICMDYNDEMFFDSEAVRMHFLDLFRYAKADVILTHRPWGEYNPDHEMTGKVMRDIAVMAPIPLLVTKNAPWDRMPSIWYFQTEHGFSFDPTDYVDITEEWETKLEMVNCMESQKQWMTDNYGSTGYKPEDFYRDVRICAEFYGMQAGCTYAEPFIRAREAYRSGLTERVLP